jgi:hypothetical protein
VISVNPQVAHRKIDDGNVITILKCLSLGAEKKKDGPYRVQTLYNVCGDMKAGRECLDP